MWKWSVAWFGYYSVDHRFSHMKGDLQKLVLHLWGKDLQVPGRMQSGLTTCMNLYPKDVVKLTKLSTSSYGACGTIGSLVKCRARPGSRRHRLGTALCLLSCMNGCYMQRTVPKLSFLLCQHEYMHDYAGQLRFKLTEACMYVRCFY